MLVPLPLKRSYMMWLRTQSTPGTLSGVVLDVLMLWVGPLCCSYAVCSKSGALSV